MLFNSAEFALFLPIVFVLYWFGTGKNLSLQNLLLLVASYFFYACWDFRFLFLLIFSTFLDYYSGIKMADAKSVLVKKTWFWISIAINLGFLGVFKYYNFFAASFAEASEHLGLIVNPTTLNIILPVGISFYTFHGLSYVIDIYKNRIEPERNIVTYSVFVSFFPLLVAGPIERATHLLPQIKSERSFNYHLAIDGLRQILWGLFKKIVIADQCARYANPIFSNYAEQSGSTLAVGAVLFAFQIYCDFSGYSDIAIGTAKLFGIKLLRNFSYPYFSRDIAEFWRRWHISLSSWFRDYLYIPLGGSRVGTYRKIRNVMIIFLVSGFWHGANWTFIAWGFLNALYILPAVLLKTNRDHLEIAGSDGHLPSFYEMLQITLTFSLTVLAWIFFRSQTLTDAVQYIYGLFSKSLFSIPSILPKWLFIIIVTFVVIEWIGRKYENPLKPIILRLPKTARWALYYFIIFLIMRFSGKEQEFIYFQF